MSAANQRLQALKNHIDPTPTDIRSVSQSQARSNLFKKNSDDIVITYAARTPLTKAHKGLLKDTSITDLVITLLSTVRLESQLDPNLVEDVCLGNVLAPSAGYVARSSVLAAGYPITTAASVANRFCSSGLLAIQQIANQIIAGSIEVGIAIGAESMSTCPDNGAPEMSERILNHPLASQNQMPMGQTSEEVAGQFDIPRSKMDAFAARSFQRAERSQREGWTKDEIVPMKVSVKDPRTGVITEQMVDSDDGPRWGTTAEGLSKIRAAFPQWPPSHTTGGNASQITDGAAAVLLMKRSKALALDQPILGKFVAATVIGLEPRIMGIGPSYAIPKILSQTGLSRDEVDIYEINEAFASMGVYCVETLGLDPERVNPRGGAIALGHPLGCTGVRQVVTALSELRRRDQRVAVTSMCVGTGMGMAGVFVSEH